MITFPECCHLNDAEKQMLGLVLNDNEVPCDGCVFVLECGGPSEQREIAEIAFKDAADKCVLCGEPFGSAVYSEMVGGKFLKCSVDDGDWTFEFGDRSEVQKSGESLRSALSVLG